MFDPREVYPGYQSGYRDTRGGGRYDSDRGGRYDSDRGGRYDSDRGSRYDDRDYRGRDMRGIGDSVSGMFESR